MREQLWNKRLKKQSKCKSQSCPIYCATIINFRKLNCYLHVLYALINLLLELSKSLAYLGIFVHSNFADHHAEHEQLLRQLEEAKQQRVNLLHKIDECRRALQNHRDSVTEYGQEHRHIM